MKLRLLSFLFSFIALLFPISLMAQSETLKQPKLLVGIKIDGLNINHMQSLYKSFGVGGFRKIMDEATQFENMHHRAVVAGNSAELATIMTGSYPFYHGVNSDFYFDRKTTKVESILYDNNQTGIGTPLKYSAHNLLVSTLTDELVLKNPQSRVHSVGIDAESAIMMGGHTAGTVSWLDMRAKRWVTTAYYRQGLNKWADMMNVGDAFKKNYSENMLINELALSVLSRERMGLDASTDILMIQYSLLEENVLASKNEKAVNEKYFDLDNQLQRLFYAIERQLNDEQVLYFIMGSTADVHKPEDLGNNYIPAGYFNAEKALALLNTYLIALYGNEKWVLGYNTRNLYLNNSKIDEKKINRADFYETITGFLGEFEGMHSAYSAISVRNFTGSKQDLRSKLQNSYYKKTTGDIILVLKPGWIEVDKSGKVLGNTNSPQVKIDFYLMGGGLQKGERVSKEFETVDIAVTLADLLKLARPNAALGYRMEW